MSKRFSLLVLPLSCVISAALLAHQLVSAGMRDTVSEYHLSGLSLIGNERDPGAFPWTDRRLVSDALETVDPQTCTYLPFKWHAETARPIAQPRVTFAYADIRPDEIHEATGCTVCEEDQVKIDVPPLILFRICRHLADSLRATISRLIADGAPLFEVDGYRAAITRGPLDSAGLRTVFSSHAYGTAIDVNPELNGFYHNCPVFGPDCRLMQGGAWQPGVEGTLDTKSPIVLALKRMGFLWGGEIAGTQKDFMHFSPTGY